MSIEASRPCFTSAETNKTSLTVHGLKLSGLQTPFLKSPSFKTKIAIKGPLIK